MPSECSYCGEFKLCKKKYGTDTPGEICYETTGCTWTEYHFISFYWICKDCDDYLREEHKNKIMKNNEEFDKKQKAFVKKRNKFLKDKK